MKTAHFFSSYRGLGGVEAILQHHRRLDERFEMDSRFIIYFEDESEPVQRVRFLGINGRSTIRRTRAWVVSALADFQPDIAIYHGMWGMQHFGDLDRSSRRVLHGDTPDSKRFLSRTGGWFDGFVCIGEPVRKLARECLPNHASERFVVLPVPISPVGTPIQRQSLAGQPFVIGFCSRLAVHQKRVDRFPEVCRHLDQQNIEYRLEFLGDGSHKGWLKQQFPDRSKFIFHGRKGGEEYWDIVKQWDVILFLSDYEGTPVSMLEAMTMGVVPIYPRIDSGADDLVHDLDPHLLYEPGNCLEIVRAVRMIQDLSLEKLDELRSHCRASVAPHLGDNYLQRFAAFMREVLALPRVGTARFRRRPWPFNDLSFAWLERFSLLRRKLLRQQ